jgi:hypothetical protein
VIAQKTYWYGSPKENRVWMSISILTFVTVAPKMTLMISVGIYIVHSKMQGLMSLIVPSVN